MNQFKILVVDDERPLANALNLKFTREGFMVDVAYNGKDGLVKLEAGDVDVLLLDLMMPEIDGFSVLEELQNNGSSTQVIVLSNLSQEEDIARVKALGAKEYFVKSNTPIREIVDYVKELLHESTER